MKNGFEVSIAEFYYSLCNHFVLLCKGNDKEENEEKIKKEIQFFRDFEEYCKEFNIDITGEIK